MLCRAGLHELPPEGGRCRDCYRAADAARKRRQRRPRGLRTRVAEPATSRLYESLVASKRRGTPFDKAWRRAMVRAMDGVPTRDRESNRGALEQIRSTALESRGAAPASGTA